MIDKGVNAVATRGDVEIMSGDSALSSGLCGVQVSPVVVSGALAGPLSGTYSPKTDSPSQSHQELGLQRGQLNHHFDRSAPGLGWTAFAFDFSDGAGQGDPVSWPFNPSFARPCSDRIIVTR